VLFFSDPGTGKTHTIVNQVATALAKKKSVIVTSSNSRALKAAYDKLPSEIQRLALYVASVNEHGLVHLQSSVDRIIQTVQKSRVQKIDLKVRAI